MSENNTTLTLAGDFPAISHDEWITAANKSLKGKTVADLSTLSLDDFAIEALYPRAADQEETLGQYPYTRAGSLQGNTKDGWEICQNFALASPEECNSLILEELNRGVTGIHLSLSHSARAGRSNNTATVTTDEHIGGPGIELHSLDDLSKTLHDVYLDIVMLSFDSGMAFLHIAELLQKLWSVNDLTGEQCRAAFNADPIGSLALTGELPVNPDDALKQMVSLASDVVAHYPVATSTAIDTTPYHNAGASNGQELGIMLATGKQYLQSMLDGGISINDACQQIQLRIATDTDYFQSAAKLRAARTLWAKMTDACGATGDARTLRISAHTSRRMLTRADPWVNMLRTTVATSAAAIGGADSITVDAFDSASGSNSALGRRVARNIPIILMEESGLHKVVDPMGGSGHIENLTSSLCDSAWQHFQTLERGGGIINGLMDETIHSMINKSHNKRMHAVRHCLHPVVGVSEFPLLDEAQHPQLQQNAAESKPTAIDTNPVTEDLAPPAIEISPIRLRRLSEPFEKIRVALDDATKISGTRPCIYLAATGDSAEYLPRVQFSRNLLAAGGIQTTDPQGSIDDRQMIAGFEKSDLSIAVVCVSQTTSDVVCADYVTRLRNAGASTVLFAGPEPAQDSPLTNAGVDHYLYKGCDAVTLLSAVAQTLEVSIQ